MRHSFYNAVGVWWRGVKQYRRIYIFGLLSMILTNGTEVLAPKTLQWIIDALIDLSKISSNQRADFSRHSIWIASGYFLMVAIGGLIGRFLWRYTFGRMTHVAGKELKCQIWHSIRQSSLDRVNRYTLGDLMSRSIGDVNSARWIYGFTLVGTCDVLFFTTLGAFAMMQINSEIALLCLATFLMIPPMVLWIARKQFVAHDDAQKELSTLSENVSQAVRGIRSQRASNSFNFWVRSLTNSAERYAGLRKREQLIAIESFPLSSLPTLLSYGILFWLGPGFVIDGSLSIGEFAALASYIYMLQGPLGEIGNLVADWQNGFSSINRIDELRAIKPDESRDSTFLSGKYKMNPPPPESVSNQAIEVENLAIARSGRAIFANVNFSLKSGQWLGIQGAVGSGKSTLLQALAGLISIEHGGIKIFGQVPADRGQTLVVTDKRTSQGHSQIVYAPERPFVFAGTIRHNLSLNSVYTDDQLWEVLEIVCMDQEVKNLKLGLDSLVGEGGVSLSGGQRQRLALARVVLRSRHLVLLDDPLSAVDVYTESKIVGNLRRIWSEKAVIWTSNKVSTLRCCDVLGTLSTDGLALEAISRSWTRNSDNLSARELSGALEGGHLV